MSSEAAPSLPAADAPLRVLALAPLPYESEGRPAFHGGGTVFYASLLSGLARRGHSISVIADAPPARPGERRSGIASPEARLQIHWFAYDHYSSVRQPSLETRRVLRARVGVLLEKHLRESPADLVLIGREVVLPYAVDVCRQRGVATAAIAHGPAVGELDVGGYPRDLREDLIHSLCAVDRVVAVAGHVAAALRRLGVERIDTIPNMIDPQQFRPRATDEARMRALGIPSDALVVAHVSVLRPWKRAADVVESAEIVLRSETRCVYLVVGDGPCRAELEEQVRRRGLERAFRFTGEVRHADVPALLASSDVVVQPSEREGAPLVYREAQACGCALVASDIPAAREAIVHRRTGLLFPVGDVAKLASTTLEVVCDAGLRRRLGDAAREEASRHSIDAWLEDYERALRRAVS